MYAPLQLGVTRQAHQVLMAVNLACLTAASRMQAYTHFICCLDAACLMCGMQPAVDVIDVNLPSCIAGHHFRNKVPYLFITQALVMS